MQDVLSVPNEVAAELASRVAGKRLATVAGRRVPVVGGLVGAVPASAAPDDSPSLEPVQGSPFESGRYIVVLQKPQYTRAFGSMYWISFDMV